MSIIDPTFGLHRQSLSVMHALASEPGFAPYDKEYGRYTVEFETFPFYNCRERLVGVKMRRCMYFNESKRVYTDTSKNDKAIVVLFGENKNSDNIVVYHWIDEAYSLNPPTVADMTDERWESRKFFDYLDVKSVVEYIQSLMENFARPD